MNQLLHRLAQVVLQLYFLLFELVLDLTSALLMLSDTGVHPLLGLGHSVLHPVDFGLLALNSRLEPTDLLLKLLDHLLKCRNLILKLLLSRLVLLNLSIVRRLQFLHRCSVLLLLLSHRLIKTIVQLLDHGFLFLLKLLDLTLMLLRQFFDGLPLIIGHLLLQQVYLTFICLVKTINFCLMVLFQILGVLSVLPSHIGDSGLVFGLHLLLLLHHLIALLGMGGSHLLDLFFELGYLLSEFVLNEFLVTCSGFAKLLEHGLVFGFLGFELFAGLVV